jgi:hypothetical protein
MRRVVFVLIVALVGAGFAGRLVGANAVRAGSFSLPSSQYRAQLDVLAHAPNYTCYLQSQLGGVIATNGQVSPSGSSEWLKVQVEALAFESLLTIKYHWHPGVAQLATARTGLLNDFTQSEATVTSSTGATCATSATAAFSLLPHWFQQREVLRNAASIELLKRLGTVTALTPAGAASFYAAHRSAYDTVCVSIAYVPQAQFSAFEQARTSGLSVAALARQFSADPSAAKGGAAGCFAPGSSSFSAVRRFVLNEPLNQFSPRYQPQQTQNGVYVLYVAPTKRTPNSLTAVLSQVVSDIQRSNSSSAAFAERRFLQEAHVAIDPALGVWSMAKVTVLTPRMPSLVVVANAGAGLTK